MIKIVKKKVVNSKKSSRLALLAMAIMAEVAAARPGPREAQVPAEAAQGTEAGEADKCDV
ncbi:hypothetical protein QJS10_CPA08g01530 [Acorus calamus]|uniref:Uncharacterized protein n=1 Tax=Acorus calamus TaxID=4465 RepID=A0AAV9EE50_ACOCL|nr:hypothetical protein QJS10_CPA08g01530 [Acorus calamus]